MKTKSRRFAAGHSFNAGFAMIDLLMAVAVLSAVVSLGYFSVTNLMTGTKAYKLRSDVASLNAALQVYLANGGNLDGVDNAKDALNALKTTTSGDNWKQIAGIRGTMVDMRIALREVKGSTGATAVWDDARKRFSLQSGGDGISEFVLDDSLAVTPSVQIRDPRLKLAVNDGWVWDYKDTSTEDGTMVEASSSRPEKEPDPTLVGTIMTKLLPPRFSHYEGTYGIDEFPMAVSLTNENPTGSSTVYYTVGGGDWKKYVGNPVSVMSGQSLKAYAATIDPENFALRQLAWF